MPNLPKNNIIITGGDGNARGTIRLHFTTSMALEGAY